MSSKKRANSRPAGKQDRKARVEEMRAAEKARERRQRLLIIGGGAGFAVLIILIVVLAVSLGGKDNSSKNAAEVLPPSVGTGTAHIEAPAQVAKDTSGIPGVVAYVTTGWPSNSNNGPKNKALAHDHLDGPIKYSVTPPVGGDHNGTWMNCGVYTQPVPSERAVHNLEHGAVWITYQPSLPQSEIDQLKAFVEKQSKVVLKSGGQTQNTGQRYMDLTPFPSLPSPIVMTAWGHQLPLTSATDPRMQKFVDTFRTNPTYSPEYGAACDQGVGTPAAT